MFLKLLNAGETRLEGDENRIVHLIRNASNLDFPELKNWIFKKKEGYVKATKRIPIDMDSLDVNVEEEMDLIGVINYITQNKPTSVIFKNLKLSESDYMKIERYTKLNNYSFEKKDGTIKCQKNSAMNGS